jgi:hypothetical protein
MKPEERFEERIRMNRRLPWIFLAFILLSLLAGIITREARNTPSAHAESAAAAP